MDPPTPAVMLVPVVGVPSTAPPGKPWILALKRLGQLLLPLLPALLSALIDLYQSGQVDVPAKWVPWVTLAILLYQTLAKQQKEQDRQYAATALRAQGLPVGETFTPQALSRALFSSQTLLETEALHPRSPIPDPRSGG